MGVMKKNISRVICLGVLLLGLTGCGSTPSGSESAAGQTQPVSKENTITYQLLKEPELNYRIPELTPSLCVPSGGYDVAEDKKAYVYATLLPQKFYLLEKESLEVVYTGAFLEVKYHKDTESYSGVADFSEFAESGEYVLWCDYLGYSYPFTITESLQENTLIELVEGFEELFLMEGNEQSKADSVLLLLLSHEFYGEVYEAEENGIPQVLQVVHTYVESLMEGLEEEKLPKDSYMMAALLAKYGNNYQAFDWNQGNDAIKLAKKLWKNADEGEKASELGDSNYRLLAAAELYKATGTYSYRKVVQDYFDAQLSAGEVLQNNYEVLAALTHFTTDYKVNRSLCTSLMDEILDKAEEIYAYISLDNQLLEMGAGEEKLDEIMWNMVVVSVVEYVITNYEYGELLEEEYFYLQGRNPQAVDYVSEMIVKEPRMKAAYVMMLCEHLAHDHLK